MDVSKPMQKFQLALHPQYDGASFKDVVDAKASFIFHLVHHQNMEKFIELVKLDKYNNKPYLLYKTARSENNLFGKISIFSLLTIETDWSDLENNINVMIHNSVQIQIKKSPREVKLFLII